MVERSHPIIARVGVNMMRGLLGPDHIKQADPIMGPQASLPPINIPHGLNIRPNPVVECPGFFG